MGLASRGLRDMDDGPQRIKNAAELAQVQRQARTVYRKGLLSALALTAGWMIIALLLGG